MSLNIDEYTLNIDEYSLNSLGEVDVLISSGYMPEIYL